MSRIPSSSPIYTPIKRLKRKCVDDLEPVTLFHTAQAMPASQPSDSDWHTAGQASDDLELPHDLDFIQAKGQSTPKEESKVIPNSQWWEESSLPPVPSLYIGPDDTVDSDTDEDNSGNGDDGGSGENTQFYLKQILTESMVESLPLPPQQKLKAKAIIHSDQ